MTDKQPLPFQMSDEDFAALATEIRDLVNARTPDFGTAASALLSMAASMMEAHLVSTDQWSAEKIIAMKDFFAINILRSHGLRIKNEGGDPNTVRAEDVMSASQLKKLGLLQ